MSFRKAPTRVSATIGGKEIILETGRVATQAHGSVTIQCGGTVVLVTVCSQPLDFDRGFFPLTVEYSERMYAAGRIPGSFFRREIGRPSERETLVSRLIDRPIRPLFPKGLPEDVQVLASVISSDQENESDVLSITAASAAVMLSPLPFAEAVAGGRIGRINGQFILNPTVKEMAESDLNIVFAASADALVMVEGEATFVPEDVIIDGPRAELSKYAPQHAEVFVNPEVIRMIIGPGGKNIKAITAATGASVDIEDSGRISIFAPTAESMEQAKELVQYYDQRPDLGKNYMGKVRKVLEIGAIVEIMPNVEALVHISQLDTSRVAQASDVAHLGEDMLVKVIEINGDRIRASRKAVLLEEQGIEWKPEDTARPARAPRGEGDRDHRGDRGDRGERRERRPRRD